MSDLEHALASAAYALFALEQPLSLADVEIGTRAGAFPAAATHTPDWFAAAAEGFDLLEMAPELQVLPADLEAAGRVDLSGIDLIRVYAPEMTSASAMEKVDIADEVDEEGEATRPDAAKPGAAIQIGLLRELGGLDD